MKIIHTSDWHLGQTLYDYDRSAEQLDMLRQMTRIVEEEQPDALLVSGDVYHTGNPTPAAVKMYNRALLEMRQACPAMQIVVTAGNHDSASRIAVNNDLWDCFGVTVIGSVAREPGENRLPDYTQHIIKVKGNDGETIGFVAAVPHCYESNFPTADQSLQREERMRAYFQGLLDAVKEQNPAGLPVALMAHLAVSGCDLAGHENIGGMETRDVGIFGTGYDYVALGHIHTPQDITDRIRYCGTPIPVNFGERFDHSVSVVELEPGQPPRVTTRSIKNLIPLHDLPTEPAPFSEVYELAKGYDPDELCYLRLLIKVDESMTPLADTLVAEAVKDKKCRVCRLQFFEPEREQGVAAAAVKRLSGHELRAKTPLEIAEIFFDMRGAKLTESQRQMIKDATERAEMIKKGDSHEDEA